MSRSIKRKVVVLGNEYYWVLNSNSVDSYKEHHIRVHAERDTKSILYIDPYPWHLEIRPKTIERAIDFAILSGWNLSDTKKAMYISMNNDEFYVLPEGVEFGYQDENNAVNKNV